MKKLLSAILTISILSCNSSDNSEIPSSSENTKVTQDDNFAVKELVVDNGEDEGWGADVKLSITSNSETDTSNIYTATST
jgi:hypothetical protein